MYIGRVFEKFKSLKKLEIEGVFFNIIKNICKKFVENIKLNEEK